MGRTLAVRIAAAAWIVLLLGLLFCGLWLTGRGMTPLHISLLTVLFVLAGLSVPFALAERRHRGVVREIAERAERAAEGLDRCQRLLNAAVCGILQIESQKGEPPRVLFANAAAQQLLCCDAGEGCFARLHPEDRQALEAAVQRIRPEGQPVRLAVRAPEDNGQNARWLDCCMECMTREGEVQLVLWDCTDHRLQEEELRRQAECDALTTVCNKAALERCVRAYLRQKDPCRGCAFLMFDFDNFKEVNDVCGHACGDEVLHGFGLLLRDVFRADDLLGRIGGDEFAVLMRDVADEDAVRRKADRVLQRVRTLCDAAQKVSLSCSAGVSILKSGTESFETLYRQADEALYRAKNAGKNRCES